MKIIKKDSFVCIVTLIAKVGKINELLKVLLKLVDNSTQETGIVRYELHQDEGNPNKFTFVDRFVNEEAFKFHCDQPYVKKAFDEGELDECCDSIEISTHSDIKVELD